MIIKSYILVSILVSDDIMIIKSYILYSFLGLNNYLHSNGILINL